MRSAMPACFGAVTGKVWPSVRAVGHAAVATSHFSSPCLRFRRCGGLVCALDRTKCQAGGWLAFGSGKCGWLRALTPRVCACVLVAMEMPFSSTFSAAAGATEVL